MLISKKFPRPQSLGPQSRRPELRHPSDRAFAGPDTGHPGDFPLRRYMRLREDLGTGAAHVILTILLMILVVALGRVAGAVFARHGESLSPWYGRGVWMLIAIFTLSAGRVLYYKLRALRRIRREMSQLRATFRNAREAGGDAGDDGP